MQKHTRISRRVLLLLGIAALIMGIMACNLTKLNWKFPFSNPLDDLPLDELPLEDLPDLDELPLDEIPLEEIPLEVPLDDLNLDELPSLDELPLEGLPIEGSQPDEESTGDAETTDDAEPSDGDESTDGGKNVEDEASGIDLAIIDLYADKMPNGVIIARVTNKGAEPLTDFATDLYCLGTGAAWAGIMQGVDFVENTKKVNINLAPEESEDFNTGLQINGQKYKYELVCEISFDNDTNQNNNVYRETIPTSKP